MTMLGISTKGPPRGSLELGMMADARITTNANARRSFCKRAPEVHVKGLQRDGVELPRIVCEEVRNS